MIERAQIAAVKLIPEDQLAEVEMTLEEVELAVQQSVGWGVTRNFSILLRLATELHDALDNSEAVDELRGKLKGLQLTHGRLKKQLDREVKKSVELQKRLAELESV